ncbi:MAG: peptidylprolyl isomerase [Chthoniobacteraceae bacterium]
MISLTKALKEPLSHFFVLGAAIFAIHAWRRGGDTDGKVESARRIEVNSAAITWLREGFTRQWHRAPDAEELRGLVNDHLREEVLYREALAMGLDRDDSIVRRRMAQKMEFLTQDIAGVVEPDNAALRKFFEQNAVRYAKAARVSFRHVFFSKERRGVKLDADAGEALAALGNGASDESMGDPFLREYEFKDASADEIATALGREFAEKVAAMPAGEWRGPVASSYGVHLVRVSGRAEPQPVAFEAVRDAVARDFSDERRRTTDRDFFERLKAQYRITVDEAALRGAAAPPTKTATR